MSMTKPRSLLRIEYEKAAEAYLRSLPEEHFMEATSQATQRKITLESLDLVTARRPEVQCFNELCVQYPGGPEERIRRVVPDNMVVVHSEPIHASGSYNLPFQPVDPFWVLEYVSKESERKDYDESFRKYEQELRVRYYLLFYPEAQELTLYHLEGERYAAVRFNEAGRLPLLELDLEMALLDGWVRFWYQGELLQLPAALEEALEATRRRAEQAEEQAQRERQRAEQAEEQAQRERQRAANAEEQAERDRQRAANAEEQAERERQAKERLLAQLRALGIKPET